MQDHTVQARVKDFDPGEYEFELERGLARERARKGLLNFTLFTKPNYRIEWYHRALCQKLNAFARGEIKRLMVFMPPRHGKSELVSRRLPAFIFGRNPSAQVIATSYASDLASRMNRDVQRIIDSPEYQELFPFTRLNSGTARAAAGESSYLRNSDMFEIVGNTGVYRAAGVGGGITGMGGDFLIIDDPIKDQEQADSEVYREKVYDWYASTLYTRAEGDAGILVTLTRWHEGDVAGRLLAQAKSDPEADQWEVFSLPAIREIGGVDEDPRDVDEALWPAKFPIERLRKMRATMGARKFNALYQQRPSAQEGEILKRAWMQKRYKSLPVLRERSGGKSSIWDDLLISADLRFKDDKKTGDYVVFQAWARLGAQIYFLGESRGRWSFTESLTEFSKICVRTPIGGFAPDLKLVENKANGPALENVLRSKISGIVLDEPEGSKTARANAVTPLWEAGNVWLPDDSIYPEINAIIEEWVSFGPGCAFDDRTDTMTQALKRFQGEIGNSLEDLVRW